MWWMLLDRFGKKCPRFMIRRRREITLYRPLRPWKSSATQTQFGIF